MRMDGIYPHERGVWVLGAYYVQQLGLTDKIVNYVAPGDAQEFVGGWVNGFMEELTLPFFKEEREEAEFNFGVGVFRP